MEKFIMGVKMAEKRGRGRPPGRRVGKIPVSVKLPPDLEAQLRAACEATGRTLGNILLEGAQIVLHRLQHDYNQGQPFLSNKKPHQLED